MKRNYCSFLRLLRTDKSETWSIGLNDNTIGVIHLHFTSKYVSGDIILKKKITKSQLDFILTEIEEKLVEMVEPREDFIFSVLQAKEIGFYSDIVDHELSSPTKKDLNEHKTLINSVLSKYQDTRGQLSEHVVKEYFEKIGFVSKKAGSKYDALKVDVISENPTEVIFCQVKLGSVSARSVITICETISRIEVINSKNKIAAIVAESFPLEIEAIKTSLETKLNMRIWIIHKQQVLDALPEYKRTLKK